MNKQISVQTILKLTVPAILFVLVASIYILDSQNRELKKLLDSVSMSRALEQPYNYKLMKDLYCEASTPEKYKVELKEAFSMYEIQIYSLLYENKIPSDRKGVIELTQQYLASNCEQLQVYE